MILIPYACGFFFFFFQAMEGNKIMYITNIIYMDSG